MIKKQICKIFAENNLKISIEANHKSTNFLDITMDLRTGEYKPYMKPNNTPIYIHKDSNHPPSIIKNIPESINKRLSSISSNESTFNKAAPPYQEALNKSGYAYKLKYKPTGNNTTTKTTKEKRSRKRNITWFNPPYSKDVKTDIGKNFLKLIDTCFPPSNILHKVLNRNTVKISYSCMENMKQIISKHNKIVTENDQLINIKTANEKQAKCNCRQMEMCPLDGHCLSSGIIYQATVTRQDNKKEENYIGLTDNTFKTRYNAHTSSFRNENKRYATTLSKLIWSLKDKGIQYSIKWRTVAKCSSYSPSSNTCNLCLREKCFIIYKPHMASLNSRNELPSECRHRKRYLLSNLKT